METARRKKLPGIDYPLNSFSCHTPTRVKPRFTNYLIAAFFALTAALYCPPSRAAAPCAAYRDVSAQKARWTKRSTERVTLPICERIGSTAAPDASQFAPDSPAVAIPGLERSLFQRPPPASSLIPVSKA